MNRKNLCVDEGRTRTTIKLFKNVAFEWTLIKNKNSFICFVLSSKDIGHKLGHKDLDIMRSLWLGHDLGKTLIGHFFFLTMNFN